jgi:CheY-like chemotaxis protein
MSLPRILIVDDDENLRWVLKTQLDEAGYDAITATDGEQALALIEKQRPALVLSDLRMPGLSGMDLLHRMRVD